MHKILFLLATLLILNCTESTTSENTQSDNFLANKKLYLLDKGNPSGWTNFKSDKTFIEDDGETGTYKLEALLLTMYFSGFRVESVFPKKEIEAGDIIRSTYFQGQSDSIKTEFEVLKLEDAL
jgi:hypothetical protein